MPSHCVRRCLPWWKWRGGGSSRSPSSSAVEPALALISTTTAATPPRSRRPHRGVQRRGGASACTVLCLSSAVSPLLTDDLHPQPPVKMGVPTWSSSPEMMLLLLFTTAAAAHPLVWLWFRPQLPILSGGSQHLTHGVHHQYVEVIPEASYVRERARLTLPTTTSGDVPAPDALRL